MLNIAVCPLDVVHLGSADKQVLLMSASEWLHMTGPINHRSYPLYNSGKDPRCMHVSL